MDIAMDRVLRDFENVQENSAWAARVDSIQGIKGRGIGKKAVIAGAGATLEELEGWKPGKDVVLIANQSSAPYLVFKGIIPDLIVISDAGRAVYERVEPILSEAVKMTWIVATKIHPQLWRALLVKDAMCFHSRLDPGQYGQAGEVYNAAVYAAFDCRPLPFLMQAGTVVNASVMVAAWMGIKEIYFAGVDFGYPLWPKTRVPRVVRTDGLLTCVEEVDCGHMVDHEIPEGVYPTTQEHEVYRQQNRQIREILNKDGGYKWFTMNHNILKMEMEYKWPQ